MKNKIALFGASLLALSVSFTSYSDDLELYKPIKISGERKSNILFVLDDSGSMKGYFMPQLKRATKNLINKQKNGEINIGLMNFNNGKLVVPVRKLTDSHRRDLIKGVNSLNADGSTPLSETLYEAYLYFYGEEPRFENYLDKDDENYEVRRSFLDASGEYKSPISKDEAPACGVTDSIILFTDGEPSESQRADNSIDSLISGKTLPDSLDNPCKDGYNCLDELAWFLGHNDSNPYFDGDQIIKVYTVGFDLDSLPKYRADKAIKLLKSTAENSKGIYTSVTNEEEIEVAFTKAVEATNENTSTVSSSSITVNQFSKASHENYTFYAMFKPSTSGRWEGNIKKYQLASRFVDDSGNVIPDSELTTFKEMKERKYKVKLFLEDKKNKNILDATNTVKAETLDLWNPIDDNYDGGKVNAGGIRSAMKNNKNKEWSFLTYDESSVEKNLTAIDIDTIECTLFDVIEGEKCNKIKRFLVGKDESGNSSNWLGDIIHSTPTVITYRSSYSDTPSLKGNKKEGDAYLFAGSNDGYVHAFDVQTGTQKFSFIPEEFYRNIRGYVENNPGEKLYGFDGPITADYDYELKCKEKGTDKDCDKGTDVSNRDYVKTIKYANLYVGMRRGGTSYYSLDVTDIDHPKFRWVIRGSALGVKERYGREIEKKDEGYVFKGKDTEVDSLLTYKNDFSELAQTWSKPIVTYIKSDAGKKIKVIIFSGGYDPVNDDQNYTENYGTTSKGNAVFIVNAETGELIKKATGETDGGDISLIVDGMNYSLPGGVAVVDKNGDNFVDDIFTADVRGNIFRIHLPGGSVNKIKAKKIASLGHKDRHTRFFTVPRIAFVKDPNKILKYSIAIGSGNRANPRDKSMNNGLFVIFQDINYDSVNEVKYGDLKDISSFGGKQVISDKLEKKLGDAKSKISTEKTKVESVKQAKKRFDKNVTIWFDVKRQLMSIDEKTYLKSIEQYKKLKGDHLALIDSEITILNNRNKFIDNEIPKLNAEIVTKREEIKSMGEGRKKEEGEEYINERKNLIAKYENEQKDIPSKLAIKNKNRVEIETDYKGKISSANSKISSLKNKKDKLLALKSQVAKISVINQNVVLGSVITSAHQDNIKKLIDVTGKKLSDLSLGEIVDKLGKVAKIIKGKKAFENVDKAVESLPDNFDKDDLSGLLPDEDVEKLASNLKLSDGVKLKKDVLEKYLKDNTSEKESYNSKISSISELMSVKDEIEIRSEYWKHLFNLSTKLDSNQKEIDFSEFSNAFIDRGYFTDVESTALKTAGLIDRVKEAYSQVIKKYEQQYSNAEKEYNTLYTDNKLKINKNEVAEVQKAIFASGGWKKMFVQGWKILSPVTIRDHQVRFTAFTPSNDDSMETLCGADLGQSLEYSYGLKTLTTKDPIKLGAGFYESPQLFRTYYVVGKKNEFWKPVDLDGDGKISERERRAIKKPMDCLFGAAGAVEECKDIDVSMNMVYWKNWLKTEGSYSRVFEDADDSASSSADSDSDAGGKSSDPSGS
ncbi:VWA domain-containing protein [Zooshikella harenae]|uniref:VWA domain-containing protein n=1 Tax=Zooshikella harenae TaxID=2827238 RepID=A0ABS5Z7Y0_9GAMM|nr:VWA domain-containing protein [Zooshikella harenae]MBU2710153.1 VWA domain-containing protein [Zooshikella harenae]